MGKSDASRPPLYLAPCYLILFTALALALGTACQDRQPKEVAEADALQEEAADTAAEQGRHFANYRETGDLPAIEKRGIIRFVQLHNEPEEGLSRTAIVSQTHEQLARRFAARLGLTPYFLIALTPQQAIEMVIKGEADVLADNFAGSEERGKVLGLTEPLLQGYFVLATGKKGPEISDATQLKDVQLTVIADSTPSIIAHQLADTDPSKNLTVRELPVDEAAVSFFKSVKTKTPDITIVPEPVAQNMQRFRDDIKIGDRVGPLQAAVWAVRKDARQLQSRLNNYLIKTLVKAPLERKADWDSIKESGVLRFATYNGPGYFLWKGVLTGLDYELARKFASDNDLELQIIVVPNSKDLADYVKTGRADIAGASTTITKERTEKGVEFSIPILSTSQRVLSNRRSPPIETREDLNGRTLTLRAHSAFIATAQKLRASGIDVKIQIAPEGVSFAEILNGVASGEFDATLEDTNLADMQAALRPQMVAGIIVTPPLPQGWMVASGNNSLLGKIDQFLKGFLEKSENRAMVDNYFKPDERLLHKARTQLMPGGKLSPYDELVKKYAFEHNLDWRLVVAQMWQESNFDPKAESHVGAQGLLQVMPRTAQEMGFKPPLFEPEPAVQAGTKYLEWVRARFEDELPADEKLWFSLAAYNAGIGHVRDARALATQLNLDPNKWFDNVEVAMLKLSEPQYFEQTRYGYARGAEPVLYVRKIRDLYRAYADLASGDVALVHNRKRPKATVASQFLSDHVLRIIGGRWVQNFAAPAAEKSTPSLRSTASP